MGKKNFTTFSAKKVTDRKIIYVRSLQNFTLEEAQTLVPFDPLSENFRYLHFTVKSRSFLYNQVIIHYKQNTFVNRNIMNVSHRCYSVQVRRMVGALIALGLGKITEKDITVMLQVPSHHNWNPCVVPVPPNGLHLINLEYDPDELRRCTIPEQTQELQLGEQEEEQLEEQEQELQLTQQKEKNSNLQNYQLQ